MNGQGDSACEESCPGMRLTVRVHIASPLNSGTAITAPSYAFIAGRGPVLFYRLFYFGKGLCKKAPISEQDLLALILVRSNNNKPVTLFLI